MNKVFIFDFDGTFYSGEHKFDKVEEVISQNRRLFLKNISDDEYKMICDANPLWLKTKNGNDVIRLIFRFKKKYPNLQIDIKDFLLWQESMPYEIIIDYSQIVDAKFMKELCIKFPVYVVSNSSLPHIHYYMEKIGINKNWFKKIYGNEFIEKDPTKQHYYKEIMNNEGVMVHEVYIFGDSVDSDLSPGLKLGMNAFYIDNSCNIKPLITKILKENI